MQKSTFNRASYVQTCFFVKKTFKKIILSKNWIKGNHSKKIGEKMTLKFRCVFNVWGLRMRSEIDKWVIIEAASSACSGSSFIYNISTKIWKGNRSFFKENLTSGYQNGHFQKLKIPKGNIMDQIFATIWFKTFKYTNLMVLKTLCS